MNEGVLHVSSWDTFLFISHTTNVLLFKFRSTIFIVVRIIKEMPGSVASGTHCTNLTINIGRIPMKIQKLMLRLCTSCNIRRCFPRLFPYIDGYFIFTPTLKRSKYFYQQTFPSFFLLATQTYHLLYLSYLFALLTDCII